ncbi:MAG TPA: dihydrolipoamide acetyltransferase family protein [Lacipirellulaceae bacterium]|jgi:pyruvate dehydrogenase E2 component (dihydrolipoamide acetyltransferase)|nr:dihydrolipoamide acetyltransferase family protein [Lacipirellulaceae bacterium]
MPTQIKLPNLGENIESGDVLTIFVSEGDTVKANQDLMEVETDKATMPVPAPQAGKIVKILVGEGDTVEVGAAIMEIEASAVAEKAAPAKPVAPKKEEKPALPKAKSPEPKEEEAEESDADDDGLEEEESPVPKTAPTKLKKHEPEPEEEEDEPAPVASKAKTKKPAASDDNDVPGDGHASAAAGPAVRRLARQLGVELRRVRPTGDGGRVTVEDVRAHVRETNEQVAAAAPRGVTPPGTANTDDFGGVRIEKMSRMRQAIARNMVQSYTTIPQLTNFDDADITDLEDMREQSKADYADRGIRLTSMSFVIKAIASSLKRHPVLNASVDMESNTVTYKEYVNIGIAVDTERGLVVPVLRDADRKSISQIASEIEELAGAVREGKFDLDITKGGTFTISNMGSVGGTYSTPIINPPQVAILLIGRSRQVPQIVDDSVVSRLMMPLSITYDHRLVDGAAAARFTNEVKSFLAAPGRLLLAP